MPSIGNRNPLDQEAPSGPRLLSLALVGFVASSLAVIGGSLAGAAQGGQGFWPWAAPGIPVEPVIPLLPALIGYFGGLVVLARAWLLLRRVHLATRVSSSLPRRLTMPSSLTPDGSIAGPGPSAQATLRQQNTSVSLKAVSLIAILWALPMILGPPLASRDVYAYGAQGRLAEHGYDVYKLGPAALGAGDPILGPVDPLYRETPVLYGPAFVALSSAGSAVTGSSPLLTVVFYRLLALLGLVVAGFGIFYVAKSLGRDPIDALILGVANPLVLLHLVSGAHNDAIMLGLLMLGIAVGCRARVPHVAIVLCALAAAIKLPAMLAVAFIGWPWVTEASGIAARARRFAMIAIEAIAVLAVAGQVTGWGWSWATALMGQEHVEAYLSITTIASGSLAYLPGLDFEQVLPIARLVGVLMAAGLTSMLLFRRPLSWVTALAWSFLLWAVLHPTTQPWYLTWGMLVLASSAAGQRNRLYVAGSVVGLFAVLPIGPQLGLVLLDSMTWISALGALAVIFCLTLHLSRPSTRRQRTDLERSAVSVLVPTRNEALNVEPFVASLHHAADRAENMKDRSVEILFIDDSEDDTHERIETLAASHLKAGRVVRGTHRQPGERWGGLSGAVVDGLEQASGQIVVVMDGDLQHPANRLPLLLAEIDGGADLVIASRRLGEGSDNEGLTKTRRRLSLAATAMARSLFPKAVGRSSDPLSGFFAVRLDQLDLSVLQPDGFKILVEILATHPKLKVKEVPFVFGGRLQGMSKASGSEGVRFLGHLFDLRIRRSRTWAGGRVPQKNFTGGAAPVMESVD